MNTTIGAEVCWALSPPLSPLDSRLLFLVHWHFVIFFSLLLLLCAQVNDSTDELRLYVCEQGEIVWSVSKKVLLIYTPSTKNSLAISTSHIYIYVVACVHIERYSDIAARKKFARVIHKITLYIKKNWGNRKRRRISRCCWWTLWRPFSSWGRKENTFFLRKCTLVCGSWKFQFQYHRAHPMRRDEIALISPWIKFTHQNEKSANCGKSASRRHRQIRL